MYFHFAQHRGIGMSKKGSEKEFIFTLYLKLNIEILEKILGLKLMEVKLERLYAGVAKNFMVDMYALEKNYNVPVFLENVLTVSDNKHQIRLLQLINHIETGIIVYQALDFKKEHVQELRRAVKGKSINLFFVKINKSVVDVCMILNSKVHKLKIFYNLNMFNTIQNPIELIDELSVINPLKVVSIEEKVDEVNEKNSINNYLINVLRTNIQYYFSFQREKANMGKESTMRFGFGKANINLNISANSEGRAFVELSFAKNSKYIYPMIKKWEERAKEIIGRELKFINEKHKIVYRFEPYPNIFDTVDRLLPIAEKFIQAFANYTYYPDNPEMWEKFDYSL